VPGVQWFWVQGYFYSEPQNRRISNIECRRVISHCSIILIEQVNFIPSILDIHDSKFDIRSYETLNPEPLLAVQGFHYIPDILFIREAVGGIGGKGYDGFEMIGQIFKKCDATAGLEFIPSHQGLEGNASFGR
jgi:hypothetical protein